MPTISLRKYPEMVAVYERNIKNLRATLNKTNSDVLVKVDEDDYYISHKIVPGADVVLPQPEPLVAASVEIPKAEPQVEMPKVQTVVQAVAQTVAEAVVAQPQIVVEEPKPVLAQPTNPVEPPKLTPKPNVKPLTDLERASIKLGVNPATMEKVRYLTANKCFLPYIAKQSGCDIALTLKIQQAWHKIARL